MGKRYGGFWRRFFAFFIDGVILYFISLTLFLIPLLAVGLKGDTLSRTLSSLGDPARGIGLFALLYIAVSLIAGMIYFTGFHGISGRTPGKMLFGLRVIQISGNPITPGIAFLRWVGYLISAPLLCLGFLWIAFDGRKQGWHDKIAATLVIRGKGTSEPAETKEVHSGPIAAGVSSSAEAGSFFVPFEDPSEERQYNEEVFPGP